MPQSHIKVFMNRSIFLFLKFLRNCLIYLKHIHMLLLQVFCILQVYYWQSLEEHVCGIVSSSIIGRKGLKICDDKTNYKMNYKFLGINRLSMSVKHEINESTDRKLWAQHYLPHIYVHPIGSMSLLYCICVARGAYSPIVLYVLPVVVGDCLQVLC